MNLSDIDDSLPNKWWFNTNSMGIHKGIHKGIHSNEYPKDQQIYSSAQVSEKILVKLLISSMAASDKGGSRHRPPQQPNVKHGESWLWMANDGYWWLSQAITNA